MLGILYRFSGLNVVKSGLVLSGETVVVYVAPGFTTKMIPYIP